MTARTRTASLLALLFVALPAHGGRPAFDPGRVSYRVNFADETVVYRTMAVAVPPGETIRFDVDDAPANREFVADAEGGVLAGRGSRSWEWTAPREKGRAVIRIAPVPGGETVTLRLFVTVPTTEIRNGSLNGYRIGDYFWAKPWDRPIYRAPAGLIEVTAEMETTHVSPHFTLKPFLCKQSGGYPKYLILRVRLLRKLERILEAANAAGFRCDTFGILSGYRTPWYNAAIGNVKYSRHVWGGAADIFIDESPKDGMMDDLNGDGRIDIGDADVLYEIIDRLDRKPWWPPLVGGLGQYRKTENHGPFVHVDARGNHTRWSD